MSKILWLRAELDRVLFIYKYIRRNLPKTQMITTSNLKEFFEELREGSEEIDSLIIDLVPRTVSSEGSNEFLGKGNIKPEYMGLEVIRKLAEENYKIPILIFTFLSEFTRMGATIYQEIEELKEKVLFEIEVIRETSSLYEIFEKVQKYIS